MVCLIVTSKKFFSADCVADVIYVFNFFQNLAFFFSSNNDYEKNSNFVEKETAKRKT